MMGGRIRKVSEGKITLVTAPRVSGDQVMNRMVDAFLPLDVSVQGGEEERTQLEEATRDTRAETLKSKLQKARKPSSVG